MREADVQNRIINKLRDRLPGCFVLKNDPSYFQGIPDLLVLYQDRWAMLEVKRSDRDVYQPNQEYYLNMFGVMSFSATVTPENEEEVLDDLQSAFGVARQARLFEPQ